MGLSYPQVAGRRNSNTASPPQTSTTVLLPNGSNVTGYLMLAVAACSVAPSFSWPSGWNTLTNGAANTGFGNAGIGSAYHIVDGTEGYDGTDDSFSLGHANGNVAARVWTFDTHGGVAPQAANINKISSTTIDPASLSPSWGSGKTLWLACLCVDSGYTVSDWPDNYGQTGHTNLGAAAVTLGWCERENTTATEDPNSFTWSGSDDSAALTIAVKEGFEKRMMLAYWQ